MHVAAGSKVARLSADSYFCRRSILAGRMVNSTIWRFGMAIMVQPVDGLINRLLQQNGKSATPTQGATASPVLQDHVSISSHARQQPEASAHAGQQQQYSPDGQVSAQQSPGQSSRHGALESQLLELYRFHDGNGG